MTWALFFYLLDQVVEDLRKRIKNIVPRFLWFLRNPFEKPDCYTIMRPLCLSYHLFTRFLTLASFLSPLFFACQHPEPRTWQEKLFYEEGYSYGSLAREAKLKGSIDSTMSPQKFIDRLNGESDDRRPLYENSYYFKKGYQDAYQGKPSQVQFPQKQ